ncbi:hypothetical protein DFJ43DRAFT_999025 [Lentinula guzmanii]|uniref:WH1 domain-containing protein n=1 Tax=Lentinula guzmanii TaxID=2804957 RepID=A0AA38MYY6_9AGAR|nr:hypothetical protein DFJ43DRAFT_999025 [Lentinula guzmanii]
MLSSSSLRVLAEATVKLYHAKFSGMEYDWQYFNQRGVVQFCQNQHGGAEGEHFTVEGDNSSPELSEASYWFRLRDGMTGRILWTFSIPEDCIYRIDKPFFHFFNGRSRMWGFLFERDEDAQAFGQLMQTQLPASNASTSALTPPQGVVSSFKNQQSMTKLTPSLISLPQPNSFVHIGHIGLGGDGLIECSEGIDPTWSGVITELQTHKSFAPDLDALKHKELINGLRLGIKKWGPSTITSGCF